MPTLYDLTAELEALQDDLEMWAEDHDGDVTDYPAERLEKIQGEVKDKVLGIAVFIKNLKSDVKAFTEEKKALAKREATLANRAERLKKYLESCVPKNAKFESTKAKVSWANNPPAVQVMVPVESLPEKFVRRADPEADKAEMKASMLEYEIELKDDLGNSLFTTDGQPMKIKELQVRWPKPVTETPTDADTLDDAIEKVAVERDEPDYIVLARMVQGKSLRIS